MKKNAKDLNSTNLVGKYDTIGHDAIRIDDVVRRQ